MARGQLDGDGVVVVIGVGSSSADGFHFDRPIATPIAVLIVVILSIVNLHAVEGFPINLRERLTIVVSNHATQNAASSLSVNRAESNRCVQRRPGGADPWDDVVATHSTAATGREVLIGGPMKPRVVIHRDRAVKLASVFVLKSEQRKLKKGTKSTKSLKGLPRQESLQHCHLQCQKSPRPEQLLQSQWS